MRWDLGIPFPRRSEAQGSRMRRTGVAMELSDPPQLRPRARRESSPPFAPPCPDHHRRLVEREPLVEEGEDLALARGDPREGPSQKARSLRRGCREFGNGERGACRSLVGQERTAEALPNPFQRGREIVGWGVRISPAFRPPLAGDPGRDPSGRSSVGSSGYRSRPDPETRSRVGYHRRGAGTPTLTATSTSCAARVLTTLHATLSVPSPNKLAATLGSILVTAVRAPAPTRVGAEPCRPGPHRGGRSDGRGHGEAVRRAEGSSTRGSCGRSRRRGALRR